MNRIAYTGQYQDQQQQSAYWQQQTQQQWTSGEGQISVSYPGGQTGQQQDGQLEQDSSSNLQAQTDYWNNAQNEVGFTNVNLFLEFLLI